MESVIGGEEHQRRYVAQPLLYSAEDSWDKFGTKIVSMKFISLHFASLT
jgi:hypothetical protein